jgi:hypothetical protein
MKIYFKEMKEGQFFLDGNHDLCVKVRPVLDTEDLFWDDDNFNAIELDENGHFYTRWFDDDYFVTEDEIIDNTKILEMLV